MTTRHERIMALLFHNGYRKKMPGKNISRLKRDIDPILV